MPIPNFVINVKISEEEGFVAKHQAVGWPESVGHKPPWLNSNAPRHFRCLLVPTVLLPIELLARKIFEQLLLH